MVQVVTTGKTRDAVLGACIRNIWILASVLDIDIKTKHIIGKKNVIADLLSRLFSNKPVDPSLLYQLQEHHIWDKVPYTCFKLDLDL